MSECKLDHTITDVENKYLTQKPYLPEELHAKFTLFFQEEHSQDILNDVFHLLKKYDLADKEEQETRCNRLNLILKNV